MTAKLFSPIQRGGISLSNRIVKAPLTSNQANLESDMPGVYSKTQTEAWKVVTDAVHEKAGRIFVQLWHVGCISHTSLQPDGQSPVASSAIVADAKTFIVDGFGPVSKPRVLETAEIPWLVNDFSIVLKSSLRPVWRVRREPYAPLTSLAKLSAGGDTDFEMLDAPSRGDVIG